MDKPLPQPAPCHATDAWTVLPAWAPIPGLGTIAINTFVLRGREPMLVDTGPAVLGDHFMQGLRSVVDPADLRWIWLSHTDPDHIGNLARVLAEAPDAKVLTTFLGAAKMEMLGCDMSRVQLLEPGKVFDAGGHRLHPLRPPYYDAPESLGFFDETTRVMYAVDSFGAVLPEPAHDLSEVRLATLSEGMATWSSIDAPWLARSNGTLLARTLAGIGKLDPSVLLSAHLPLAREAAPMLSQLLAAIFARGNPDPLDADELATALAPVVQAA